MFQHTKIKLEDRDDDNSDFSKEHIHDNHKLSEDLGGIYKNVWIMEKTTKH